MREYNPLSLDELGRNAVRALMEYPTDALLPSEAIAGAGVYTLHYAGPFRAYANLDDEPIYVGKADPPGRRQGRAAASQSVTTLYQRLAHHARSIDAAENLNLADFSSRWLVLDPVWIGLTEQVLIAEYRPLWNVVVDGFGNNDPGRGRRNQRRSQWDTLHPGREWATLLQDRGETQTQILAAVSERRRRTIS